MREISFELTRRCNFDCSHCLRDFSPDKLEQDLSLDVFTRILEQCLNYGLQKVAITGGEPTLYPQFGEALERIVSLGLKYHFVTNGSSFGRKVFPLIKEGPLREGLLHVAFSAEGSNAELHDKSRGAKSFDKLMKAVALCRMGNIPFGFSYSIGRPNRDDIDDFCLMASHLGAEFVTIGHVLPTKDNIENVALPLEEWRDVEQTVHRLNKALSLNILPCQTMYSPDPLHTCPTMSGNILHVDWEGNLIFCCTLSGYRGDKKRSEIVADLRKISFFDAHRMFLKRMDQHNLDRLKKVESGTVELADHFPCLTCVKNFGQLDWTDAY